jgi:hypothetical protein
MTPTDYEKAVLQNFQTDWPPPQFVVRHNIRIVGKKSKAQRQIDISVFETGQSKPFMIVEAKRHMRRIELGIAGSAIALVQDVGGIPAVMVSASGFSTAAESHLHAEGIETMTITLAEAKGLRWIPLIEEKFAVDREFRRVSGDLVEALRNGNAAPFLDSDIPYEEWLAVIAVGQSLFPDSSTKVLKALAREHYDDGVRFNAILLLDEADALETADVDAVITREYDHDALELLRELRDDLVAR